MKSVTFDTALCVKCGSCRSVCPLFLITGADSAALPSIPAQLQGSCIACGHCEAVCPHHAVSVQAPGLKAPLSEKAQQPVTAEQLSFYLQMRRSIRAFRNDFVPRAALERVFDAVRYAPTGSNGQTVRWAVVEDRQKVQELAGLTIQWMRGMVNTNPAMAARMKMPMLIELWDKGIDRVLRSAPHVAVAYAHQDDRLGQIDCHIGLSHLELAAPAFGLGACWAGYFGVAAGHMPAIGTALGIPADHVIHGALMFGYPLYQYARTPKRNAAVISWVQ